MTHHNDSTRTDGDGPAGPEPSTRPHRPRRLPFAAAAVLTGMATALAHAQAVGPDRPPGPELERVIVHFGVPGTSRRDVYFSRQNGARYLAFETTRDELTNELRTAGVDVLRRYAHVPALVLSVDEAGREALANHARILSIEPDALEPAHLNESLPIIGADQTLADGHIGTGQLIAIMDTNFDPAPSESLASAIVAEACFSTNSSSYGTTSLCPGQAPFVVGTGAARDCPSGTDGCGHGTRVARIAHAVAPGAGIIAIKVFSQVNSLFGFPNPLCEDDEGNQDPTPCTRAYVSDQIAALQLILEISETAPVAAVNMSLGGGKNESPCGGTPRNLLMSLLQLRGVAPVASSGNRGYTDAMGTPACAPAAISVGSTEDGYRAGSGVDAVAASSNSAWFLDLLAPGEVILGGSGTSFAAPHVSGAWAVLKAIDPAAPVAEILGILRATGVSVTDAKSGITTPRIQLDAAVDFMNGPRAIAALTPDFQRNSGMQLPPWLTVTPARRLDPDP